MTYICQKCNYRYDDWIYDIKDKKLKKAEYFESLSEDWKCPVCKSNKSQFIKSQFN